MYCSVIEKACRKTPRGHIYRKIEWRPYAQNPLDGMWKQEDIIPREPKSKYDIVLNHSYRECGQVKKKQYHIATIRYWEIIDGWYSESIHCGIEKYFKARMAEELGINKAELTKEKRLPDEERKYTNMVKEKWEDFERSESFGNEYKAVDNLIYEKLQPIVDSVMKEYRKSEEYRYKVRNDKLRKAKEKEIAKEKKYQENKRFYDNSRGEGYYDAHFNKDGTLKSDRKAAEEWEKNHQEGQQKESSYSGTNYNFNFGIGYFSRFTDEEKALADEIIKAGYKVLAKKYHPDAGGSNIAFQELGSVKDKLAGLV